MTSLVQERIRMFSFDSSDDAIAPDLDEMCGVATMKNNSRGTKSYPDHRLSTRKHLSNNYRVKSRERTVFPTDDEDRIPPPMEIVTNSSSKHPDFEAWKRDMTETLLSGTVGTFPNKSPKTSIQRTDWKSTRLNKRRLEKKWLQQQLRSVKSDTSTTAESESSEDEDSSIENSSYSSSVFQNGKDARKRSKTKPRSAHDIQTVYIQNRPGATGKANRRPKSLQQKASIPLSPRSAALQRPTMSAVEAPLSPEAQLNSKDLAEIMVELADLKTWAEGAPPANNRLRRSTPPSSPTSPAPPANRTPIAATKGLPSSGAQKDPSLPKSIEVPQLMTAPKSIVVPQLAPTPGPGKKYKSMIERRVSSKEMGIPTMLTIQTTASKTKKEHAKKAIKRVRFAKPLITDTKYRPKTRREDVDDLYFQEEELLDWENDEETTLHDRFEVVVTEFGNEGNEKDEEKSKPYTVISFHTSYSYSFQDSSDEESCD